MINYVNIDLLQYRPKYSHFYCNMSKRDEGPGVGGGGEGVLPYNCFDLLDEFCLCSTKAITIT